MGIVIAMDGVSGSGKSTLARLLAEELGFVHVDSGALYRLVVVYLRETALDLSETPVNRVRKVAPPQRVSGGFVIGEMRIKDSALRSASVSDDAAKVAANPEIRTAVRAWQHTVVDDASRGAVVEGRDIGTIVFRDAKLKFWMTADHAQRAERRIRQMGQTRDPFRGTVEDMMKIIADRDDKDRHRVHSPLFRAEDAVTIDTTGKSPEESLREMLAIVRSRLGTAA